MKKRYILTVLVLVLIVGAVLLILFLPKQSEEPTPSTDPDTSLATIDSEILHQWGQQAGDAIREYYSLYFHFEEKNSVFTNDYFEGLTSISLNRGTRVWYTVTGIEMRKLCKALGSLELEAINLEYTSPDEPVYIIMPDLQFNFSNDKTVYIECRLGNIICFNTLTKTDDSTASSGLLVPTGEAYRVSDNNVDLAALVRSFFRDENGNPIPY